MARREPMNDAKRVIHSDPEILGGIPVFVGTRVPVRNLIDFLEAGDSLDDFLTSFPSVSRDQAVAALELAGELPAPDLDQNQRWRSRAARMSFNRS
jgi:uncharacterized protein (DUF433 family)